MWIATTSGFFSVVADNQRPGRMLIRARCRADIFNLYKTHEGLQSMESPTSDEMRDYRWRISIDRIEWIILAGRLGQEVDYPNFKSAVHQHADQANKYGPYLQIWSTMKGLQERENPDPSPSPESPSASKDAAPALKRTKPTKTKKRKTRKKRR
jgi:hypothetical protein